MPQRLPRALRSVALCALLAAAMFSAVHLPAAVGAVSAERQLPIYCVQRDQKMVSLTFDAAWGDGRVRQCPYTEETPKYSSIRKNRCNFHLAQ